MGAGFPGWTLAGDNGTAGDDNTALSWTSDEPPPYTGLGLHPIWYNIQPPTSGTYRISARGVETGGMYSHWPPTTAFAFDTTIEVFTGTALTDLTRVVGAAGAAPDVYTTLTAGQLYFIRLDSVGDLGGWTNMSFGQSSLPPPPPPPPFDGSIACAFVGDRVVVLHQPYVEVLSKDMVPVGSPVNVWEGFWSDATICGFPDGRLIVMGNSYGIDAGRLTTPGTKMYRLVNDELVLQDAIDVNVVFL